MLDVEERAESKQHTRGARPAPSPCGSPLTDVNCPRQRQEDEINSRRILLIDRIEWRDGWPHVGTPSHEPRAAPIV